MRIGIALWVCLFAALALADQRGDLLQKVQTSDALARLFDAQAAAGSATRPATHPATRRSSSPMAYDSVLRSAVAQDKTDATPPDDLAELNEYQCRQALMALHLHNAETYSALCARGQGLHDADDIDRAIGRAKLLPGRSETLNRYLRPPVIPTDALGRMAGSSAEEPQAQMPNPDDLVIGVLSGDGSSRVYGIPSTLAPLDARYPASRSIEHFSPRLLPLANGVPRSLAMRADPPANSRAVVPKSEDVSRIAAATGVSPQIAEDILAGRTTLAEVMRGGTSNVQAATYGGMIPNDPRWNLFYYGSQTLLTTLPFDDSSPFVPSAIGGVYDRADHRVNQDFDMRTNGAMDRRVNVTNDRRTNVRVDPRVNY